MLSVELKLKKQNLFPDFHFFVCTTDIYVKISEYWKFVNCSNNYSHSVFQLSA